MHHVGSAAQSKELVAAGMDFLSERDAVRMRAQSLPGGRAARDMWARGQVKSSSLVLSVDVSPAQGGVCPASALMPSYLRADWAGMRAFVIAGAVITFVRGTAHARRD